MKKPFLERYRTRIFRIYGVKKGDYTQNEWNRDLLCQYVNYRPVPLIIK